MTDALHRAGLSFLRAFGGILLTLAPGVLAAPNLDQAYALGVAALAASVAAGIAALQAFAPTVSFTTLLDRVKLGAYGRYVDSFARAFLGTFLVLVQGVLNAPDLNAAKAAAVAAVAGAITAGLKALQELVTKGTLRSEPTLGR